MRALILVLSSVVVALTVPVLVHAGGGARTVQPGNVFYLGGLLYNAQAGESVTYRDQDGNTLEWSVLERKPAAAHGSERLVIRRVMRDRVNALMPGDWGDSRYEHDFGRHGWCPLMVPSEPEALDRLWIWARIRLEGRPYRGPDRLCWRVDFIDPALPPDAEEAQGWFHSDVPVFGLQEWHRAGRIWTLVAWRFADGRSS